VRHGKVERLQATHDGGHESPVSGELTDEGQHMFHRRPVDVSGGWEEKGAGSDSAGLKEPTAAELSGWNSPRWFLDRRI
jgi:hypothetical protein